MRKKILFIMQLPPPVHGASLTNKLISESPFLKDQYEARLLKLNFVSQLGDIGNFSIKKIVLVFPFLFSLVRTLIQFRPEIVYYTLAPKGFAFYRDALFVFFIKLFRQKIAFHLHSRGIQETIKESKVKRIIYQFVFRNQTAISLSPSLSYEFQGLGTKEILILPNGIPDHVYDLSKRNTIRPNILFLANLFHNKGIIDFMSIIKNLHAAGVDCSVNIVGGNGDVTIDDLKEIARRDNTEGIITFSGALYDVAKYDAFANASIFVHPSLDEAFPLTILEAMQAFLPSVASAVGAIPTMIDNGRTGFVCSMNDIDAFTDNIKTLLADQVLRQKMSSAARKEYEVCYTLSQFERNVSDIIRHLTAN